MTSTHVGDWPPTAQLGLSVSRSCESSTLLMKPFILPPAMSVSALSW